MLTLPVVVEGLPNWFASPLQGPANHSGFDHARLRRRRFGTCNVGVADQSIAATHLASPGIHLDELRIAGGTVKFTRPKLCSASACWSDVVRRDDRGSRGQI
jgi:hypothetical protein